MDSHLGLHLSHRHMAFIWTSSDSPPMNTSSSCCGDPQP
ncbi:hypothetical protein T09_428 [Trichinella sp. T9]|nr:hypothetical protein T09_428 [Trichinella sp. T9]